jgi:hypothetical protein
MRDTCVETTGIEFTKDEKLSYLGELLKSFVNQIPVGFL